MDPYVVYKYGFEKSSKNYFIKYTEYMILYVLLTLGLNYLFNLINVSNIIIWILVSILLFVVVNLIFIIIFHSFFLYKLSIRIYKK